MSEATSIAVLLSGRGSNFMALHQAIDSGRLPAKIVLVFSNRPDAAGLVKAKELGLETQAMSHRGIPRQRYDAEVVRLIRESGAEWVCLAGYMRILSPIFIEAFPDRIVNIHPSLLPAFPGLHAQRQAWEYGVKVSGCTVHLVDQEMDTGPIVGQAAIEAGEAASAEELSERILQEEHRLYPAAFRRLLLEKWEVRGRRVVFFDSFAKRG